jgi:hypothetical protein
MPKKKNRDNGSVVSARNLLETIVPIAASSSSSSLAEQWTTKSQGLHWGKLKPRNGSKIVQEFKLRIMGLRCEVETAKAEEAASSLRVSDGVLKYNEEDWLWRKKWMALYSRHRQMITSLKEKEESEASSDGIVAELRALAAEWNGDPTMPENAVDMEEAASTTSAEKRRTPSAHMVTVVLATATLSVGRAKKEASDLMAAAMATALAVEISRKEAIFEKEVAKAATTFATRVAATTSTEKEEATVQLATAHALFQEASLKITALDRARA